MYDIFNSIFLLADQRYPGENWYSLLQCFYVLKEFTNQELFLSSESYCRRSEKNFLTWLRSNESSKDKKAGKYSKLKPKLIRVLTEYFRW